MADAVEEVSVQYWKDDPLADQECFLPNGYKRTEVGLIPSDWSLKKVGELVASIEYGSSAKSSSSGVVPVLRMGNLQGGEIDWADLVYTDDELEISKYKLSPGDVLFNRTNTVDLVGKTSIYRGEFPAIFAGYLIRIKVDKEVLDSEYLNYILNAESSRRYSRMVLSVAVSQANINSQKLKGYPVQVPPRLEEQVAIAKALSDVDALIGSLEKLIAKKQAIKTATMQQLLTGRTRLPQFATHPDGRPKGIKQTELGEVPEDWDVCKVGSLVSITTGGRNTQDRDDDGTYPFFVRSQNVERINSYSFEGEGVLTAGDGVGTGKVFHYVNGRFDFHQRVYLMHGFEGRVSGFFFFLFFSRNFYDRIMSMTAKSSVDSVRREMITDMMMSVPSKEEQTAIAQIVSDMDGEIHTLEKRLAKTRQIKQGMMQELLTGRTRLV